LRVFQQPDNGIYEFGGAPLILCAKYPGSKILLETLINLGADVNYISPSGASAISRCISGGNNVRLNNLEEFELLLDSGGNPEDFIESGCRAIHLAVINNKPYHLDLLLRKGANIRSLTHFPAVCAISPFP